MILLRHRSREGRSRDHRACLGIQDDRLGGSARLAPRLAEGALLADEVQASRPITWAVLR